MSDRHFAGPAWKSLTIPKGESSKHSQGRFKQGQVGIGKPPVR